MSKWQLHEAKNKLSNIIDTAMQGIPQYITKRGEDAVVLIKIEDYRKLISQKHNFSEFLLSAPNFDKLDIQRAKGSAREIKL